ncbi:MAG: extracellular solute-binding protein [Planctomycetota bacterium]|nr:extracellular solute-binding protein [Planctomycetota bacterium]
MNLVRLLIPLMVVALVLLPLLFSREPLQDGRGLRQLVIISPHNEQIRTEFARAFEDWHAANHGEDVYVAWSTPGGTSEIRRMLRAQWEAALLEGVTVGGDADLMFGGGSYEFTQLSKPVSVTDANGQKRTATILQSLAFSSAYLDSIYGTVHEIAGVPLYSPDGYWFGAALSGFGIVYNRDVLAELGVSDPTVWADLADPRLIREISLVSPLQSGSVTTAFEAILARLGWTDGWRILRRTAANARSFAPSAPVTPLMVSSGQAAAGICIDFYGRYQAQAMKTGDLKYGARGSDAPDRIGYIDPPRQTVIDPDPIGMLRNAPDPELARRFIEFVLSPAGQSLWQFRVDDPADDDLGPSEFELRRMPVRKSMYSRIDRFIDQVDPYAIAEPVKFANSAFRTFIPVLFDSMAMRDSELLTEAWRAIISHPGYPEGSGIVTASDVTDPELVEMLTLFDAMPSLAGPDGASFDLADPDVLKTVKSGWLRGGWSDDELWPEEADPSQFLRVRLGAFFSENYRRIIERSRAVGRQVNAGQLTRNR